jgi:hypothetical protein
MSERDIADALWAEAAVLSLLRRALLAIAAEATLRARLLR